MDYFNFFALSIFSILLIPKIYKWLKKKEKNNKNF
ncbi:MAG: hypothetical protein MRERC_5c074 [Mycoplasmataceae bacterium RC_NB112A]|nr:MAG: hypothetical protein MRERC_5c074 [Mycoplasmataceae bacterium RC_NB112A]